VPKRRRMDAKAPALQLLADSAPVMIWLSGADGGLTWANMPWLTFVGRTHDRDVERGWIENVHPEDRAACEEAYSAALVAQRPFNIECRLRRHDGEYRWILNQGTPHLDEMGRFDGLIGSCVDITEQKRHATELQASEARFRLLSDGAPTMLWMSDANGRCIHLNRRLRDFWGIGNDDLESFEWVTTLHPEDAPRVQAVVRWALQKRTGFVLEARYRNHGGDYRVLRTDAEPHFDAQGSFDGFIGVNVDVTEQVETTDALRRSEERFARFMDNLPGLAWIKDADGRYVFINQAAAQAFGRPVEDVLGRCDLDLFPSAVAAQFTENDAQARASDSGIRAIETLPHPDGCEHYSIVSKFAIAGCAGDQGLVGGVAIDVTDHKMAEDRIKKLNEDLQQKLQERETLLASLPVGVFIAHDPNCAAVTMNAAGATMLRLPEAANASKTGPYGAALPFRVLKDGREVAPHELTMQRACRLAAPVFGEEVDVVFEDGSATSLHESAMPLFDQKGSVRGCVAVFVDITERRKAERHKNLLIDELNHRAKNTLAIVQSIASQTLRRTPEPRLFASSFTQRLDALSRAHALLTQTSWQGAPLSELVATSLDPFKVDGSRIRASGPEIMIGTSIAVTFALVLHELATNAVKHGALSKSEGHVSIIWAIDGEMVTFKWDEVCGFPVNKPTRTGFGSRLIVSSAEQFGGSVALRYAENGLRAEVTFRQ
jgi:PAS domain S-box-containing protein